MAKRNENGQTGEFRLHGDLLSTTLLAYLRNWNAYGYQLAQQLAKAGLPAFDSGTVYRTLRQLEKTGMVSSFWDTSESGPARRMYSLTKGGEIFLSGWIDVLERYQRVLRDSVKGMEPPDMESADMESADMESEDDDEEQTTARAVGE